MYFVWCLIMCVLCDNIELDIADFDTLYCIKNVIHAKDVKHANSVKISHLGDIRLDFLKVEPRVLLIYDRTKYFDLKRPIVYRIDFEYKILGMASFVWPFVGFCIVYGCLMIAFAHSIFGYLDLHAQENLKADDIKAPGDFIFVDALYNKIGNF